LEAISEIEGVFNRSITSAGIPSTIIKTALRVLEIPGSPGSGSSGSSGISVESSGGSISIGVSFSQEEIMKK